jgi:hypothetical protein
MLFRLAVIFALATTLLFSCGGDDTGNEIASAKGKQETGAKKWSYDKANLEYRLIASELKLAQMKKTYFVLDFKEKRLLLKLGGATVWSYPMNIDADNSDELNDFIGRFMEEKKLLVRPVTERHLFAATEKSSDSVLSIVSQVVRADVSLMQRDIPQRFEIHWGDGLTLEVKTEIAGEPRSKLKNAVIEFRKVLQKPFGEATLSIIMDAESAMTLYRVADRGLLTLINPET